MSNAPLGREDSLNLAFANKAVESQEFLTWLLEQTKFRQFAKVARLLNDEQEKARTARFWWRHWWCSLPELAGDSETDILLAFEEPSGSRFCLHVENKLSVSTFTPNQEATYPLRAAYMLNNTKFAKLRCTDFDTILIAPYVFRDKFKAQADAFGAFIPHETISSFIPEFSGERSLRTAAAPASIIEAQQTQDGGTHSDLSEVATAQIYKCPSCKSDNTQRQALLYEAGTATYSSRSLSTGIIGRGNLRITSTSGMKSTNLGAKYAPPSRATFPILGCVIVALLASALLTFATSGTLGLTFLIIALIAIVSANHNSIHGRANKRELSAWENAFVCLRCGEKFYPTANLLRADTGWYNVILLETGHKKIHVIQVIRKATGLGLSAAKETAEALPSKVGNALVYGDAIELKLELEKAGATVKLSSANKT